MTLTHSASARALAYCAAVLSVFIVLPAAAQSGCEGRETLRLHNAKIHTMDEKDSVVSSVLIAGGRFIAVGAGADAAADECTKHIDLGGRTAVPGIIDNHNHIVLLGLRPGHDTRIENARSMAEVLDTLRYRAAEIPAGEWITSLGGFNINQFTPPPAAPRMPSLAELDSVTPGHPVLILQGFNGPTVTNSLGKTFFRGLGITVDDTSGAIPSGTQSVRALNALRALQTFEEQKRGLGYAMTYASEVGVTTHLDQGGFPFADDRPIDSNNGVDALANFHRYRAFDSLRALYHEGKIFNRIWINFLHMESDVNTPELRARLLNVFNDFGDDTVRILGIGEFTAGGLFPGSTAWLNGTRLVAQARWRNENHTLGFNVGGVPDWKIIIDGWQSVHNEVSAMPGLADGIKNLRWVLAHVPFIDKEYLEKLNELGGGISLVGGWRYISGTATANGPPFRLILRSGIRSGMSSDGMQISPMNPWLGMYYAVTGRNARGELINQGQQITRKEVLRLYTADNGWFLNAEDRIGTIEKGRYADLIVLSADYFDAPKVSEEAIKDIYSVFTVVNGKIVHNDLDGTKRMYWNRDSRRRLP